MEGKEGWLFVLKIRGTRCAAAASPLAAWLQAPEVGAGFLRAGLTEGVRKGQKGRGLEGQQERD